MSGGRKAHVDVARERKDGKYKREDRYSVRKRRWEEETGRRRGKRLFTWSPLGLAGMDVSFLPLKSVLFFAFFVLIFVRKKSRRAEEEGKRKEGVLKAKIWGRSVCQQQGVGQCFNGTDGHRGQNRREIVRRQPSSAGQGTRSRRRAKS